MLDDLRYRLRALFRRAAVEQELDEELRYHLERQSEIARERGMPDEEAQRQARLAFGGVDLAKEECREAHGVAALEALGRDLRHALRVSRRSPRFALTAIVILAIAIAANTAVFSFVRAIVMERLPATAAGRLVILGQRNEAFHSD